MGSSATPLTPRCGHDHVLHLYDDEERLVESVAGFLADGLRAGEGAVLIVTRERRQALPDALTACGIDVEYATRSGRLALLDAADTLQTFMTPTGPDLARCAATVGALLDRAGEGGRAVRFYGEMLAVLWRDGDVTSAMQLEQLGNAMAIQRDCQLMCGYSRALFADPDTAGNFERLCELHTGVLPGDDLAPVDDGVDAAEAWPEATVGARPVLRAVPDPGSKPARRRTVGVCAHCREPVAHDDAYVRLYRRAWHLDCALDSHAPSSGR